MKVLRFDYCLQFFGDDGNFFSIHFDSLDKLQCYLESLSDECELVTISQTIEYDVSNFK